MKRIFIFSLVLLLSSFVLAQSSQETGAMRDYTDHTGRTVQIPVQPQRIASLRGEQFTAPLWELNAPIIASAGRVDKGINNGKPYPRGAFDLFHLTFDNSDLIWLGSPNEPDFEAIASANPDLILVPDWQADLVDRLSVIAPTVVIGIHSNSILERYRHIADVVGKLDEYERRLEGYRARLEVARAVLEDTIGDPSEVSVVLAQAYSRGGGSISVMGNFGAMSQVLSDLGFSEPQLSADLGNTNESISAELIQKIDADFMIGTYNFAFNQSPSQILAEWDNVVPGWDELLHAARHNQHFMIDREPMRALSFRALEETLAIFLSHLATRDFVPLED